MIRNSIVVTSLLAGVNVAKYKILGGQLSDSAVLYSAILRADVTHKITEGGKLTALSLMMGSLTLELVTKWGNKIVADTDPTLIQNVNEIIEVTDDNSVNFMGAAGWGIVGGLLTGGVGLLAGAILGGRGKTTTFAIRFNDGSQFLCSGKSKDYSRLLGITGQFENALLSTESKPEIEAAPDSLTPSQPSEQKPKDIYSELIKLDELKKRGLLTDDEFDAQKTKLLND